jgi:hypothetical protein
LNIGNPYSEIINQMRNQGAYYNPSGIEIGIVTNEDPLTVQLGDLPLNKDNLLIADYLKKGYSRQINIPSASASGSTSDGSISSIAIPQGNLNLLDNGFKKSDNVALVRVDTTKYLILCKVVAA